MAPVSVAAKIRASGLNGGTRGEAKASPEPILLKWRQKLRRSIRILLLIFLEWNFKKLPSYKEFRTGMIF
jgi:hypothetical protein